MINTLSNKDKKVINSVSNSTKISKKQMRSKRQHYLIASLNSLKEAHFKEITRRTIETSKLVVQQKPTTHSVKSRNKSYKDVIIYRYLHSSEARFQHNESSLRELINFIRAKISSNQVNKNCLGETQLSQGRLRREKVISDILQNESCDALTQLDLKQFPEENAKLIQVVIKLCELLDNSMAYVRIWLNSPHPSLENRKPIAYLNEGRIEAIDILIYAVETGQPI